MEALFYHLERVPLERVLPNLLERTLARGWRAVVQVGSKERLDALDQHLWTYAEDSFLPHGTAKDGPPAEQPVFLTLDEDNVSGANVRFLVDGATVASYAGYDRLVILFDGREEEAVARAREQWKAARTAGCPVTYWQQGVDGRWERKA